MISKFILCVKQDEGTGYGGFIGIEYSLQQTAANALAVPVQTKTGWLFNRSGFKAHASFGMRSMNGTLRRRKEAQRRKWSYCKAIMERATT
jgi:hypothetical protein